MECIENTLVSELQTLNKTLKSIDLNLSIINDNIMEHNNLLELIGKDTEGIKNNLFDLHIDNLKGGTKGAE